MGVERVAWLAWADLSGAMAFHGPSYGLSRECAMKSQAKFSPERAKECVDWIEEVLGSKLEMEVKAPFKQRENIEMYLKACAAYGLKEQDLFQVNDLYENKNLYMVVDNLYNLGGMTQKNGWDGPVLGVKQATENKRQFDDEVLKAGQSMIGLQYGTNKGASQAGMTPYGASRQIRPEEAAAVE